MFGSGDQSYTYKFSTGLNYFQGENNTGKSEFYYFLDFMFGSSMNITHKPWYKDTLFKATMYFKFRDQSFCISRTVNPEENYLHYSDEPQGEALNIEQYREKLNSIFAHDETMLRDIRAFSQENLTYRTFTLFNFLGESRLGVIQDFFDKSTDIKYAVKLNNILNFIFNDNLEKIFTLQHELEEIQAKIRLLEGEQQKYEFTINQINQNLMKLGNEKIYNGRNREEIKDYINELAEMNTTLKSTAQRKTISDLEVAYNTLTEQIKIYKNHAYDAGKFKKDSSNRKKLLCKLEELIEAEKSFDYLVGPMKELINELDDTIFFSNYLITDDTVKRLEKERKQIKSEITKHDSRFKMYNLEEKEKAIAVINEFLTMNAFSNDSEINELKKRASKIKNELRILQNLDDYNKIEHLSEFITELYYSAQEVSSIVQEDLTRDDFKIKYIKKGNILQPTVISEDKGEELQQERVNVYTGSMARHTIIQLCGYLGFLKLLLESERYPIIPFLVIDSLSNPFDDTNQQAIGSILAYAQRVIGEKNLQIFMFDDKKHDDLNIKPDHTENLFKDGKTGFNPFFIPS